MSSAPAIQRQFLEAINGPDPLAAVLRAHQILDLLATWAIRELLPESSGDEIAVQASFMLKIDLLVAFRVVPADLRPLFAKFNAVRNRFAHEHQASFDEQHGRDLFNVLPVNHRRGFNPEWRANQYYVLTRTAGLLYAHLESALERLRDSKVADDVWKEMVEAAVLPEDQWSERVRQADAHRKAQVEGEVLAARRARREKGEV